jgi:hypothetical protein
VSQTECSSASSYWKKLCCVLKGGVEVGQLHLAQVLARELGEASQAAKGVQGVTADQQVILRTLPADLTDRRRVIEEPNLSHPVV